MLTWRPRSLNSSVKGRAAGTPGLDSGLQVGVGPAPGLRAPRGPHSQARVSAFGVWSGPPPTLDPGDAPRPPLGQWAGVGLQGEAGGD